MPSAQCSTEAACQRSTQAGRAWPAAAEAAHRYLMSGSGRKRLFMELVASSRTRTGTSDRKAAASGGGPLFHTTRISPAGRDASRRLETVQLGHMGNTPHGQTPGRHAMYTSWQQHGRRKPCALTHPQRGTASSG